MKRLLAPILLLFAGLFVIAYALDLAVWSVRGAPTQQVSVNVFTVLELKGQKEDYGDPDPQQRTCNQRLFPTAATPPCWWLLQHRDVFQRP